MASSFYNYLFTSSELTNKQKNPILVDIEQFDSTTLKKPDIIFIPNNVNEFMKKRDEIYRHGREKRIHDQEKNLYYDQVAKEYLKCFLKKRKEHELLYISKALILNINFLLDNNFKYEQNDIDIAYLAMKQCIDIISPMAHYGE